MKKSLMLFVMIGAAAFSGCAIKSATLEPKTTGGIEYNSVNRSFFEVSDSPQELANARLTLAVAKEIEHNIQVQPSEVSTKAPASLPNVKAESLPKIEKHSKKELVAKANAGPVKGKYAGVIINDDPRRTAYVPHPELNIRLEIKPKSYQLLFTDGMPDKLTVYNSEGNFKTFTTIKKPGKYQGVEYKYGLRLYRL